jgi:hypothetical protein
VLYRALCLEDKRVSKVSHKAEETAKTIRSDP